MRGSFGVVLVLLHACAAPSGQPRSTVDRLQGTATWEGHFERPHATRTVPVTVTVTRRDDVVQCTLRTQWRADGDPEITTIVRDANGDSWTASGGRSRFARDTGEGDHLLRVLTAALAGRDADARIAFQHPRLGDVVDHAVWNGDTLDVVWHRATDHATFSLQRRDAPTNGDAAVDDPVEPVVITPAMREAAPVPAPAAFRTLAPGVHEITPTDAESRSLAIEFVDHLVLCETSLDNAAGERLLAVLDERLPAKPVRHVLFGHYHPHYTGGLRPLMARGATVVAPPLGAAFAREIAARPFASPPDALARSGRAAIVESFTGKRRFHDASNELVAIDIGADSHHTDEYVVFWLPRQGLLFQGDLGWFGVGNGVRAGGVRARGLVTAIDARHLPVQTLVQAWPTTGSATMTLDELRTLLK